VTHTQICANGSFFDTYDTDYSLHEALQSAPTLQADLSEMESRLAMCTLELSSRHAKHCAITELPWTIRYVSWMNGRVGLDGKTIHS